MLIRVLAAAAALALAGCVGPRVLSTSDSSVSVRFDEATHDEADAHKVADALCARDGKRARLRLLDGSNPFMWSYASYDCVAR